MTGSDVDPWRWTDSRGRIDKKLVHLRGLLSDVNLFDGEDAGHALGGRPLERAEGFRAEGEIDGRHYVVGVFWGGEVGEQVVIRGWPRDREPLIAIIRAHEGEDVPVEGTEETVSLNLNHPLAVLAALTSWGKVWSFGGDLPPGWPGEAPAED